MTTGVVVALISVVIEATSVDQQKSLRIPQAFRVLVGPVGFEPTTKGL